MATITHEVTFFIKDEKVNDLNTFLEEFAKENSGYAKNNEYDGSGEKPAVINAVAEKFPDDIIIAAVIVNKEGAGVPYYTGRISKIEKGEILKLDSVNFGLVNDYANSGKWDEMDTMFEAIKKRMIHDSSYYLQRCNGISKNLIITDEYFHSYEGSDIETLEFTQCKEIDGMKFFKNCRKLKSVKFSENFIKMNRASFADCTSLEQIEFFDKLKKIGQGSFKGCSSLKKIIFHGSKEAWKKVSIWPGEFADSVQLEFIEGDNSTSCSMKEFNDADKKELKKKGNRKKAGR